MNLRHLKTKAIVIVTMHSPVEQVIKTKLKLKLYSPEELTLRMIDFDKVPTVDPHRTQCGKFFSLHTLGLDGCNDDNCGKCIFGLNHHRELLMLKSIEVEK